MSKEYLFKEYVVYAIDKDGMVSEVGRHEDVTDIKIRISLFREGTTIEINEEYEENQDEDTN